MEELIQKFNQWWNIALSNSPLSQKSAVCGSTINEKGYPNGRFVDLKDADERGFIFCTQLDSTKGIEIKANPKVALTVWWDHVGFQVRITGIAKVISEIEAEKYWNARSRDARLTTLSSDQSKRLEKEEDLLKKRAKLKNQFSGKNILKPKNWGGYVVEPISIEFLEFREDRIHFRELFEKNNGGWVKKLLQP